MTITVLLHYVLLPYYTWFLYFSALSFGAQTRRTPLHQLSILQIFII